MIQEEARHMSMETLEQVVAVVVTAGLVAENFLMFPPWRDGQDPRELSAKWDAAKACKSFSDSRTARRFWA